MKILFHHRTATRQGQAVHIDELTAALRDEGHDVEIVGPESVREVGLGEGSRFFVALKQRLPRWTYELFELGYDGLSFLRLAAAIRRLRPDVIYERYALFMVSGVLARRLMRVPLILEVNSPLYEERALRLNGVSLHRLARWSERTAWRGASAVLPVSEVLADHVRDAGVPDERITVVHNGINPERFATAAGGAEVRRDLGWTDSVVLGFVGFVHEWHQLDRVVDLLPRLTQRFDARLVVVGEGSAADDLVRRAERLDVRDRVVITGTIERDEVPRYVDAFDIALQIGVTPYASPLKLFEYMAMGRAIVAPDTANIREIVTDGVDALLVEPANDEALVTTIERLAGDSALRSRLGAAARETIARRDLTWTANARRVTEIAKSL